MVTVAAAPLHSRLLDHVLPASLCVQDLRTSPPHCRAGIPIAPVHLGEFRGGKCPPEPSRAS